MIQHHLLLLATHFKAEHNRKHPVLMTICRNITSTLNTHWKLLQLSVGLCAQPSIMERLGRMDWAAPDTECHVPYDSNGDSSLISLFSHSLSISHHVNTLSTLPICPFICTSCGTVINHLQSKTKKITDLWPQPSEDTNKRKILCFFCGQGGQSQLNSMSVLCCLSWRYQEDTDVWLQIRTIHIHSLFTTTDCSHLSRSVQEKLSTCESF